MPLRILPSSEKRKAKRGEFKTTKGKGTKDLRDRLRDYVSKRTRPPKPDIRKTLTDAFAGGIKGKPHSSPSGRAASVGRTIKRMGDYKGGGRANFRRGGKGTGPSPGTRIKARKSREREWWTSRGGPEGTKGDTRGEKFFGPLDKELRKKRPHSSPEGRDIDVRAAHAKYAKEHKRRQYPKMPKHGYGGTPTPKRAAKAVGSLVKGVKKIITKLKPKPKPPKGKGLGSGIKPSEAKDILKSDKITRTEYLKKWSPYFGGRSLKQEMKETAKKGKASGGRIGLQHGSRPRPSGPHTWVKKKPKGVKIAIKGW